MLQITHELFLKKTNTGSADSEIKAVMICRAHDVSVMQAGLHFPLPFGLKIGLLPIQGYQTLMQHTSVPSNSSFLYIFLTSKHTILSWLKENDNVHESKPIGD
jgi:hypothetical protein